MCSVELYLSTDFMNCNIFHSGAHNEKERTTLNTAREPTFRQKYT